MRSRGIVRDDRAATPVVGIILMVMVTVLLAAVVGSFALGLASFVDTGAPAADVQFEHDGDSDTLTIVHEGGEGIPENQVEFVGADATWDTGDCDGDGGWASDGETVSAGDVCLLTDVETDDTVQVIWFDRNSSGIVAEWSGADAS